MKVLNKVQVSALQLRGLASQMSLEGTLDNIRNYNESVFENYETIEREGWHLSINVSVSTSFINDEITVNDVTINNVELWINEDEDIELTDKMIITLQNEITNQVKNFV